MRLAIALLLLGCSSSDPTGAPVPPCVVRDNVCVPAVSGVSCCTNTGFAIDEARQCVPPGTALVALHCVVIAAENSVCVSNGAVGCVVDSTGQAFVTPSTWSAEGFSGCSDEQRAALGRGCGSGSDASVGGEAGSVEDTSVDTSAGADVSAEVDAGPDVDAPVSNECRPSALPTAGTPCTGDPNAYCRLGSCGFLCEPECACRDGKWACTSSCRDDYGCGTPPFCRDTPCPTDAGAG